MAGGKTCFLAALCSLVILTIFVDDVQSASCCLRYTESKVPCRFLTGYTIQSINRTCDIPAIIFHLHHSRTRFVCTDPQQDWTQKMMSCVDEKRRKQIIREITSGHTK